MTATITRLDHHHTALANARLTVRSATASQIDVLMACDVLDTGGPRDADLARQLRIAARPSLAAAVNEAASNEAPPQPAQPVRENASWLDEEMLAIAAVFAAAILAAGIGLAVQAWWLAGMEGG